MRQKLKQLSKETILYGISTVLGRLLNFVLVPFYTNVFLPKEMGEVANLFAYIAFLNVLFIYGLDSAYLKFASLSEWKGKKDVFSTSYLSIIATSILFSALLYIFRVPAIGFINISPQYSSLFDYSVLILMLDALTVLPFISLRLQNNPKRFVTLKLINIGVNVGLNIFLIVGLHWGIEAIFVSNLAASAVTILGLFPVIAKQLTFGFVKPLFKRLMKFGLPFFPGALASMVMQAIDKPIVDLLVGKEMLGIYQMNYRLGVFMMLFVSMFQYAWQPFFLQHAEDPEAKPLFSKVLTLFTLVGSLILVSVSLFIDDLAHLHVAGYTIIGARYWAGLNIVPVILLAYLFNGFYVNFNAGLYIKEKSLPVPFILGLGAVVKIGCNFLLIPGMGIMGAAFASFAGYFVIALGAFFVSQKVYRIEYEFGKIGMIFVALAIVAAGYYGLQNLAIPRLPFEIGLLGTFVLLLFLFRIISKREIKIVLDSLMRRKK